MKLSTEQLEEVEKLSGAGYTLKQIAMYLDVPLSVIEVEFHDSESIFRYHYDRGILMVTANNDKTLVDSAKGGSVTAVQMLEKRLRERRLNDFKEKMLHGHH